jgi:hypothetical protein
MAVHASITAAAPFTPAPPAAITRILSRFDRDQLAGFIAVAIDLLDAADGDSDIEPNGDELDGSRAEDDFIRHIELGGPGCPFSDPAEDDDAACRRAHRARLRLLA